MTDEKKQGQLLAHVHGVDLFTGMDTQRMEPHLSRSIAVIVLVSGHGVWLGTDRQSPLRHDHLMICPPGGTFGLRAEAGEELSAYIVRMDLVRLHGDDREAYRLKVSNRQWPAPFDREREVMVQPAGRAAVLCREIATLMESVDPLQQWRAQHLGNELALLLMEGQRANLIGDTIDGLHRSKLYMDEHYTEAIAIEKLAAIAEVSPKYYVDIFKKTYGLSAVDYLTQVRMNRAKVLMLRNEQKLRDVAHAVGYEDEFYFSRKFKKRFGVSPSAYMKKRGKRIAVYGALGLTGFLLPLGIVPYAAPLHPKWTDYYCEKYGVDIAVHLDAYRYNMRKSENLNKLAHTRPEWIIVEAGLEPWEREGLERLAPVYTMPDAALGWRRRLLALAAQLEEQAEAERWISQFERKIDQTRCELLERGRLPQTLVLKLVEEQIYVFSRHSFGSLLYEELGLPQADGHSGLDYDYPITLQELALTQADCVLLLILQESRTLTYWKTLQQSHTWMSLRFIQENRLHIIPSQPWRENSPHAMERMLAKLPIASMTAVLGR